MDVDFLERFLKNNNIQCYGIHGDKTQNNRQVYCNLIKFVLDQFSRGKCKILIATSVASRGLDFPHISYVINREVPRNIDDYVHRVGRTGRAGYKGTAITLVKDNQDRSCLDLQKILRECKQEIPTWFDDVCTNLKNQINLQNNNRRNNNHRNNHSHDNHQRRTHQNNRNFNMDRSHRNSHSDDMFHNQSFRSKREFNKRSFNNIDNDI